MLGLQEVITVEVRALMNVFIGDEMSGKTEESLSRLSVFFSYILHYVSLMSRFGGALLFRDFSVGKCSRHLPNIWTWVSSKRT